MGNIIDSNMGNAIKCALKIESLDISDNLKRNYYVDCIKKASIYTNNVDLILLFYGRYGYDRVKDVNDILKYVFISNCLRKLYDRVNSKKSASNISIPWANNSSSGMNETLFEFFKWIKKNNGYISMDDLVILKSFYRLIEDDKIQCQMKPRFLNMNLIDIISGITNGNISFSLIGGLE